MHRYQLIFLGDYVAHEAGITKELRLRAAELGLAQEMLLVITPGNWQQWDSGSPSAVLYFGEPGAPLRDQATVQQFLGISAFIIPVVTNLTDFYQWIPQLLWPLNGFALNDNLPSLVNLVMEGLGLLRSARRLFISYRRTDSAGLALQLYHELDARGFKVFLDTQSVPVGADFQEELWHQMADTDVILMIDTPGFRDSRWTLEELGKAAGMSIGILRLLWPGHETPSGEEFEVTCMLQRRHFRWFTPSVQNRIRGRLIPEITALTESLRARNLAARQQLLVRNFLQLATLNGRSAVLTSERYIAYHPAGGGMIAVIPAVGVPDSFLLYTKENLIRQLSQGNITRVVLLYDRTNIRRSWEAHLGWLNGHITGVQSLSLDKVNTWTLNN